MGRYIRIDDNNTIVSVRFGPDIVDGEIESVDGDIGQVMQPDGTFITPERPYEPVLPTIEERLQNIENTLDILLLKQEGII